MCVCSLPAARFVVHVRRPGVIVLQNKQEQHHYLAIKSGTLCTVGVHYLCTVHVAGWDVIV